MSGLVIKGNVVLCSMSSEGDDEYNDMQKFAPKYGGKIEYLQSRDEFVTYKVTFPSKKNAVAFANSVADPMFINYESVVPKLSSLVEKMSKSARAADTDQSDREYVAGKRQRVAKQLASIHNALRPIGKQLEKLAAENSGGENSDLFRKAVTKLNDSRHTIFDLSEKY